MITPAELPLNNRNAVYHLDLLPEELADTVITVGDPDRVGLISRLFDSIEVQRSHREFKSHTGYLNKKRITVLSTGIGMPNIDIVMNELDALVNIDLNTRTINPEKRKLSIIRLGTTGGLKTDCVPGDIVISRFAIGFDTLANYYQYNPPHHLELMKNDLSKHLGDVGESFYLAEACSELSDHFSALGLSGITVTCGGFYGPQGRQLRIPLRYPSFIEKLKLYQTKEHAVVNLEMETAAIYALGSMLGHRCLSVSVVLANRAKGSFVVDVKSCMDKLITNSLALIESL